MAKTSFLKSKNAYPWRHPCCTDDISEHDDWENNAYEWFAYEGGHEMKYEFECPYEEKVHNLWQKFWYNFPVEKGNFIQNIKSFLKTETSLSFWKILLIYLRTLSVWIWWKS